MIGPECRASGSTVEQRAGILGGRETRAPHRAADRDRRSPRRARSARARALELERHARLDRAERTTRRRNDGDRELAARLGCDAPEIDRGVGPAERAPRKSTSAPRGEMEPQDVARLLLRRATTPRRHRREIAVRASIIATASAARRLPMRERAIRAWSSRAASAAGTRVFSTRDRTVENKIPAQELVEARDRGGGSTRAPCTRAPSPRRGCARARRRALASSARVDTLRVPVDRVELFHERA